jgi:hypothetical protein
MINYQLFPTPYTLHPTPYTLHPTPQKPLQGWLLSRAAVGWNEGAFDRAS